MARVVMALSLLMVFLLSNLASAHIVDLCQDETGCASELSAQLPMDHHSVPDHTDHDCACPVHHHSCAHHPIYGLRNSPILSVPDVTALPGLATLLALAPSPLLDGPFQPPKA